jgi:hypothetical protein
MRVEVLGRGSRESRKRRKGGNVPPLGVIRIRRPAGLEVAIIHTIENTSALLGSGSGGGGGGSVVEVVGRSFMHARGVVGECGELGLLEVEFGAAEELEGTCGAGPHDLHHAEGFHAFGEADAGLWVRWVGGYYFCVRGEGISGCVWEVGK